MINAHQFQKIAKQFRGGRISLQEFTELVFQNAPIRKPNEERATRPVQPETLEGLSDDSQPIPIQIPSRPRDSHKGDFGRVVAIGGSAGMAGAISLAGLAALRSGSGLVKVVVPETIQAIVASLNPCLMTVGCPSDTGFFDRAAKKSLVAHAEWADVVAIGPGLGRHESLQRILGRLYPAVEQPMIVDADGLNVLADAEIDLTAHEGQRILTPHPGEFQRLAGTKITNRTEMEQAAKRLADSANVIMVLKGSCTYVTDGLRQYRNATGNPGMATAGSGDVLTGVITSLVGQGLPAFDAAVLGVYIHGIAGDFAAEAIGETSLIATDIVESLPVAFKKHALNSGTPIGFLSN